MALLSRIRQRPVTLEKEDLLHKAIAVARRPGSLAELPSGERDQVEQVVKALHVGGGVSKAPRTVGQLASRKPVSAAILAARAHATLGPSTSITPTDIALALQQQGLDWSEPFAPGEPLQPFYGYGRRPRGSDYKIGRNTTTNARSDRIPYGTLKQLYDGYDVAQICTRHAINSLRSMRVRFEAMDGYGDNPVKEIAEAKSRLRRPDGKRFLKNWLAQNMLDLWRYDSAPIYRQRDRAGNVTRLLNVSATTIAPMLDYYGDFPEAPAPAFQQFIEGLPWDWLTWDDILYHPFWPATESPYGTPPLETVLINANTDVRLQLYFLQFFTAGTVPEAFAIAPEDMTSPDDIADFQEEYSDYAVGDQAERYGLRWLPHGTELEFYKPQMFDPDLAEYVMRRTVSAFLQTPHDLGFTDDVNRASGDTQMDVQFRISDLPTCGYYEDLLDSVLQEDWGLPVQLRFDTGGDKEDRLEEAQAHQIYVGMGAESTDEVREKVLGYPINPEEKVPRFWDSPRLGPVPLEWLMSVSGDVDPLTGAPRPGTVEPRQFVMVGQQEPDPLADDGRPNQPHGKPSGGGASPKAPGVPVTASREKAYPRAARAMPGSRHGASGSVRPSNGGRASGTAGYGQSARGSSANGLGVKGTEGITSDTGIAGVDLLGTDDELDEREDLRKWRRSARKAVDRGASPRHFADSAIRDVLYDVVWKGLESATTREQVNAAFKGAQPEAAGIIVQAEDTGRVLMIQRTPDKHDPDEAYARWEFPGGKIDDDDEDAWAGAVREWSEETGADLPDDYDPVGSWTSPDGVYWGFVVTVPSEDGIELDPDEEECSDARWWAKEDLDDPQVRGKVTEILPRVTGLLKAWGSEGQLEPKLAVHYRENDTAGENCGACTFMNSDGSCQRVEGLVDPDHVCDLFVPGIMKLSPRSGMVSLDIEPGVLPVLPGGIDDHHITVVYLGPDVDDALLEEVCQIANVVAQATSPLEGTLGGQGTFEPSESSDWMVPVYVVPDVPGIESLRGPFERFNASQHKDFHPHATLAYLDPAVELPEPLDPLPIRFTHLSVHRGTDEVRRFAFGGTAKAGDARPKV